MSVVWKVDRGDAREQAGGRQAGRVKACAHRPHVGLTGQTIVRKPVRQLETKQNGGGEKGKKLIQQDGCGDTRWR